jgi:hypothetical protein
MPRYCYPNHHRTSPVFHCWNYAFRTVGFLVCSPNASLRDVADSLKEDSTDHITRAFPVVWCPGFMSWHHHLDIWALLSAIWGFAIAALLWVLDLWSSRQTVFMETRSSRWIFSSAVICAAVVLWIFETILLKLRRSHSVNVDFHPLFPLVDVVLPWFVYADVTLETVALDTPNNMAVFVTDAPEKTCTNDLFSFKIRQVSHFPILSHGPSLNTITNALTRALQSVNNGKKRIQCCQPKFFQCSQHEQILFLNFLVFPSFCSPLAYIYTP